MGRPSGAGKDRLICVSRKTPRRDFAHAPDFAARMAKHFVYRNGGSRICSSMWKNINLEKCLSHIDKQLGSENETPSGLRPAITISRMCGAGGRSVASKLLDLMQAQAPPGCQWTIFDKNLIEKVLEDHLYSARLAKYLPESGKSFMRDLLARVSGEQLPAVRGVEHTVETLWKLARSGYVIIVGRAGNIITARLDNVFHVRLVGSLARRIARVEEVYELERNAAATFVKMQDAAKKLYLKDYFGRNIDDPELYHLVINTDLISYADAARLIAEAATNWLQPSPFAVAG